MAQPFITKEQLKKNGGGGGGSAASTALAPAWDNSEDCEYIEGALVVYNNTLYECTETHPVYAGRPFSNYSTYWKETTIADSVLGLLNTEL